MSWYFHCFRQSSMMNFCLLNHKPNYELSLISTQLNESIINRGMHFQWFPRSSIIRLFVSSILAIKKYIFNDYDRVQWFVYSRLFNHQSRNEFSIIFPKFNYSSIRVYSITTTFSPIMTEYWNTLPIKMESWRNKNQNIFPGPLQKTFWNPLLRFLEISWASHTDIPGKVYELK